LAIGHAHVIALATGGPETGVRLRDVIRQTHQLRADRVVIDDVRDESAVEALAVLATRQQATLVGMHPAGHGLDGIRALARLDGAPTDAVDALLASGAQVLVDLGIADGQPRVVRVAEVGEAGGRPDAQDLFVYDGGFSATGQAPSF
jgi:Flp pilus assembly CpaF family ATPase